MLDDAGNKIKAVGIDGEDGADGEDGKDGENGADGTDGKDGVDGITPQLKIENEYWYISYDNGATWIQLGKARMRLQMPSGMTLQEFSILFR